MEHVTDGICVTCQTVWPHLIQPLHRFQPIEHLRPITGVPFHDGWEAGAVSHRRHGPRETY